MSERDAANFDLGQTRPYRRRVSMSALPAEGDIGWRGAKVSFVPMLSKKGVESGVKE
jgi:hypothetical protein